MAQDPLERLKRLLGEMQLEVERLSRRLYAVGERLDDLAFQLSECVKKPALLLNPASVGQVLANVKEENSLDKALLVLKAERGVQRVVVFPRPGGGFKALVDGQCEVELSGQTGVLLELLIAPGGRIEDQFVGWKTVAEICKALGEKAGRPVTRENLYHCLALARRAFCGGFAKGTRSPASTRRLAPGFAPLLSRLRGR